MLSFEKTYKTLIKTPNLFISEKIEIDDTKDVYGYSLKTFIPEELAYFESYIDAVIRDAEKNKEKLISSKGKDSMMNQYGIMLSIVNDQEYVKARQKISSQSLMKIGLREFYDPSLIDMGVPSLRYVNGQFFLKFRHNALTNPNLPTLVEESEWKNIMLENIKFFITDSFYTVLDCVDQQNNPLSKDLTEFFQWRENKIQFTKLTKKLPELDGVFENKKETKTYIFEAFIDKSTNTEINKIIHDLLLKCIGLFNIYFHILGVVKEEKCFVFTLPVDVYMDSKATLIEGIFEELRNTFMSYFSQEHKALLKGTEKTNSVFFSLPKVNFNWTEKKIHDLQTKLPELKGIFETLTDNEDYQFIATFEPTSGADHKRLLTILKDMTEIARAVNQNFGTKRETVNVITNENGQVVYSMENPVKWDFQTEVGRNSYARAFNNSYKAMASQFNLRVDYTAKFKNKYEDLAKKLPELKGIFENAEEKYVLAVTFHDLDQNDKYMLEKLLLQRQKTTKYESTIDNNGNSLTYTIFGLLFDVTSSAKDQFERLLRKDISVIFPNLIWEASDQFFTRIFKNFTSSSQQESMYKLSSKLPEIKGLFEATVTNFGIEGYTAAPKKGKFQIGDLVKVIDPENRWHLYQSKKSIEALNQVAEIVGYKGVPGAYTKYAIKLPNGNIYGIHSHLLRKLTEEEIKLGQMVKKLPELQGIFESAENTEEEFYYTKEETQAIEEIAEVVQKLVQSYEERLTALMKSARIRRISLQDSHFNKYIAVTHLRNDLRLQIGKICKKHFQDDVGNKFGNNFYVLYERIFNKPLKGLDEIVVQGGVAVMLDNDGVFEIDFDTYDYQLNEIIIPAKLIEPIEIKNFLKRLYAEWIKATFLKRPLAFPKMYLELRQEKLKYNKLKQKLPELEDIF